ncbi:unnamed protein product, partial [Didymodactylos carnosus]
MYLKVIRSKLPMIAGATITQQFAEVTSGADIVDNKFDGAIDELFGYFSLFERADKKTVNGGELVLGGVDKSKFTGSIIWTPITVEYYWQFSLTKLLSGSDGCQAVADAGTSFIHGYTGFVNAIHNAIGVKYSPVVRAYVVPCSKVSALPSLTFTVSDRPLTLLASHYTFKYTSSKKVTYCASSLIEDDSSQGISGNIEEIL